jgi:hypothetical protein
MGLSWINPLNARTLYSASVDAAQETITLIPVAVDQDATIWVDGVVVASGSASAALTLAEGSNRIEIKVSTAEGSAKTT